MLHREQVVAGGHAGAAHVDDVACGAAVEQALEFRAQHRSGLEASLRIEIVGERAIERARNMSGGGVHRFDVAAITRCGTRIDQHDH